MSAVVTGASGFVGRALVKALLARGRTVNALVRRREAQADLESLGASTHLGDLTEPGSCRGLAAPGDTVYHAAARVDMTGRWKDFERLTIDGTRNLLRDILPDRPKRVVYLSSGAVYGGALDPRGNHADRTPADPARHHLYGRAKLDAENVVRAECDHAGCEWSIVRLGVLYGVGNRALIDYLAPMLAKGRVALIGAGDNRIATLYIDDAVEALCLAGERSAAAGRVYDAASDERVTQKQFMDATADTLGLPRAWRNVRLSLALLITRMIELGCGCLGRTPPINRAMIDLFGADQALDSSALRTELGWRPEVTFAEGMRRVRTAEPAEPSPADSSVASPDRASEAAASK